MQAGKSAWSERVRGSERECVGGRAGVCIGRCVRAREWELVCVGARYSMGAKVCGSKRV